VNQGAQKLRDFIIDLGKTGYFLSIHPYQFIW